MITLDAVQMQTPEQAHEYLKNRLALPEYYGKNLDALYDCLTQCAALEVEFVNLELAQESYFSRVLAVFQEAREENPKISIFFRL